MFTRLHHIVHPFCEHSHLSRRVCSSCNFNRSLHNIHGTLGMFFRKRECCSCVENHVNVKQGRVCLHVILQAVRIAGNQSHPHTFVGKHGQYLRFVVIECGQLFFIFLGQCYPRLYHLQVSTCEGRRIFEAL